MEENEMKFDWWNICLLMCFVIFYYAGYTDGKRQPNKVCVIYAERGTPVILSKCDLIIEGEK